WAALALSYAWALQYLQFWYPSRDPVGSDAVFNCAGLLVGLLLTAAVKPALHETSNQLDRSDPLWPALLGLLLLWLAYRWFPLVPTLDLGEMKHALKPLLLHPRWDLPHVLHDIAAWSLWFWLARHGPLRPLKAPWAAVLVALGVLAGEPLFVGGSISLSNVLGLGIALLLRHSIVPLATAARPRQPADLALVILLASSITVSELAPFVFDGKNQFLWLPFAGMLSGSMVLNTASLIEKCYLYGGVLVLLARIGMDWRVGACMLAAGLGALEGLQTLVPGRTPESTDAVMVVLLAISFRTLTRSASIQPRAIDQVDGAVPSACFQSATIASRSS
ncbi:MAG: hypothetical protein ABJB17_09140, partial [Burkholderiales bacterium]